MHNILMFSQNSTRHLSKFDNEIRNGKVKLEF